MGKNTGLMSQKEKDYIAFCFNRSYNSLKTDIDYGLILDGKRVDYDFKQGKREIKTIFGKRFKKSRKYARVSANTKTPFLEDCMLVSQFFEILAVLTYVKLDMQSTAEIEDSAISHFGEHLHILCNSPKTFDFLGSFLDILPEPKQADVMRRLFTDCHKLGNDALLFNFLDRNISKIPVDESFVNSGLWSCNAGCLLGLFLILKGEGLLDVVLASFLDSDVLDCEYLHKFVDVLVSLCNDRQRAKVEEKLRSAKISHVASAIEALALEK